MSPGEPHVGPAASEAERLRLMSWLSPSYPIGAFSYSHGLDRAVEAGLVVDRDGLVAWLEDWLRHGGGWTDGVLFAEAHRRAAVDDAAGLAELVELAAALAPTSELQLETVAQGAAFLRATLAAWPDPHGRLDRLLGAGEPPALPVVVAAACAAWGSTLTAALPAYLHAATANLISAAVRLVPLGQTDGQRASAALLPVAIEVARSAAAAGLDQLGASTLMIEICAMRHETQHTRLFRS